MDVPAEIEALLKSGLTQSSLAEKANVSQPTVSRARRRVPLRRSKEYERLCSYIQMRRKAAALPEPARNALVEIWDGSPEHAEALATLIRASQDLWRGTSKERGDE